MIGIMMGIAKTIGRLLAVLVDAGVVEGKQVEWILEPLDDKAELREGIKNDRRDK